MNDCSDTNMDSTIESTETTSTNSGEQTENNFEIHPRRPSVLSEADLPEYITYSCIKSKDSMFSGGYKHYQLSFDDKQLYHARVKSSAQIDPIPISAASQINQNNVPQYVLLTNNTHEAFSLREKEPTGNELLIVSMYQIVSVDEPKTVRVVYKNQYKEGSTCLVSRKPTQLDDGTWILDFSDRYTIPSKKNAILVDEQNDSEVIVTRKVEENEIEIDAIASVPPLYVFATSLAFWLAEI